MELENAVCLITGASSGIGAATARLLSAQGAHVVLAARRLDRLEALGRELPGSLAVQTDVTDPSDVDRLLARTRETFGTLDVLVNNAGQGLHVPVERLRPDDLRAVFDLNVVAPLALMQGSLAMLRVGGGAVVNVSSATSLRGFPGLAGYAATKAALNVLSEIARAEWAGLGVSVSLVYPLVTATEFHQHLRAGQLVSGGREVVPDPPELVARAIQFAVERGDEHVFVADPPCALQLGVDDWTALQAARNAAR